MNTTTTLTNTYQTFFSKQLLNRVKQETQLLAFAKLEDMPKNAGATTIRFFRPPTADLSAAGAPATLTEGVAPSTERDISFTTIDVPLVQIGQKMSVTDVVSQTALLNTIKAATDLAADEFTLDIDVRLRNPLCNATTGLTKRYAQALANYAALTGASDSAGKIVPKDLLISSTYLYKTRAPRFGSATAGKYGAILSAGQCADLMDNAEFREVVRQNNAERIFNGEVGEYYGTKVCTTSVPFTENATEGTFSGTDNIHVGLVLGKEAFGAVNLASLGSSLKGPKLIIVDKPDSNNPLGQKIYIGWKTFWGNAILKSDWGVALRSRTTFR
jgi:N4-gp56 family major capsid protein